MNAPIKPAAGVLQAAIADLIAISEKVAVISGSALLAGERHGKDDKTALYRIACELLGDVGYVQSLLEAEVTRRLSAAPAEPAAWVTPLRYGSQVTFYKPPKPEGWDDDDGASDWFCEPLYRAALSAAPEAKAPAGWRVLEKGFGAALTAYLIGLKERGDDVPEVWAKWCLAWDETLPDNDDTFEDIIGAALTLIAAAPPAPTARPIDMVLYCPACGTQHIDAAEEPPKTAMGFDDPFVVAWENPPHRSHLCHGCGHIWRPADVPTNGVEHIKSVGRADSIAVGALAAIAAPTQAVPVLGATGTADEKDVLGDQAKASGAFPDAAGVKLWLWKNFVDGRPEFWAFDNPFPVQMDCGDPQTIGEPCGYAIFKASRAGRTDVTEEQVLRRITNAKDAK